MSLKRPCLTYEDIRVESERFLGQYHPTRKLPIPIDAIVEFGLGLHIIPVPSLYQYVGANGFLTSDLSSIYVDQLQFEQYEQKYRFTLAHEIGHLVLHRDVYETVKLTSISAFKDFYESVDSKDMSWFDTQASRFAELVLVPADRFREVCAAVARDRESDIRKFGDLTPDAWSYLAHDIARPFNVSPGVVECRLTREGIRDNKLRDYV